MTDKTLNYNNILEQLQKIKSIEKTLEKANEKIGKLEKLYRNEKIPRIRSTDVAKLLSLTVRDFHKEAAALGLLEARRFGPQQVLAWKVTPKGEQFAKPAVGGERFYDEAHSVWSTGIVWRLDVVEYIQQYDPTKKLRAVIPRKVKYKRGFKLVR